MAKIWRKENVNWYSHFGNTMEVPQKTKNRTTTQSNNSTIWYVSDENEKC